MVATVLLVDDHELIRQGLRRAFERAEDFSVVAEAGSVAEAVALAKQHQPDVVVVDVRLPDGNGLDLARALRDQNDEIGIVVLTMYAGDEQLFGALEAGASAFVAKDAPAEDVVSAARHAVVSPRSFSASDLAEAMRRRLTPSGPQLSPREQPARTRGTPALGRRPGSRGHRPAAVHQRVDDEDAYLEALREARRSQPRPSPHVGHAPAAHQVSGAVGRRLVGRAQ
jgi:DNA-binding NarL/FixJ family response regulator